MDYLLQLFFYMFMPTIMDKLLHQPPIVDVLENKGNAQATRNETPRYFDHRFKIKVHAFVRHEVRK